jgi:hypothetical protein
MNIREIQKTASEYDAAKIDPALQPHALAAIVDSFGVARSDERWMYRAKLVAVWLWLGLTVITATIAIGGALTWIAVDQAAFAPLWTTFGVGFAGVVVAVVRSHWVKGQSA